MSIFDLIVLGLIGGVASFLCAGTGGTGLITTPSLIFFGLSPSSAIATDLFAMLGSTLGGGIGFHQNSKIDWKSGRWIALISGVGAIFGTFALLSVPDELLERIVGVLMLIVLPAIFVGKREEVVATANVSERRMTFGYLMFLPLGFYATFFGAGVLTFATIVLIYCFGKTMLESAGTLKLMSLVAGLVALIVYGGGERIDWLAGSVLLISKVAGSYSGAHFAVRLGDRRIRVLFGGIVVISAIKLLG